MGVQDQMGKPKISIAVVIFSHSHHGAHDDFWYFQHKAHGAWHSIHPNCGVLAVITAGKPLSLTKDFLLPLDALCNVYY